ncbi:M3 family oligoendopeptidase [Paenibacillus enshidis]|uniref:M3 family oligoendopeptidase n=1 Tax=Paenibacillus enshidis TaxID=1458439 RepID=A0ABV5ASF5_9BACL
MKTPLQQTWDLESIFSGGSSSPAFADYLNALDADIKRLLAEVKAAKAPQTVQDTERLDGMLELLQDCGSRTSQATAFVECLGAQNQDDKGAVRLGARIHSLRALLETARTVYQNILRMTDDDIWARWLERDRIKPVAFVLNESREEAREKMAPELESLALDLAVDGYHGWGGFYDTIVSKVSIPVEENGKVAHLSAGQAANKLHHADRAVREKIFAQWEKAWTDVEDYCADTLNHLGGFRLKLYENRGWHDVLKEPLSINRMSKETLDMMWQVIVETKPVLVKYLERKARLLRVERLSWHDIEAPLGASSEHISYDKAAVTIIEQFAKFSPDMAAFAEMAFEKSWIEAEDRPGKRPGGFCTSLPVSKETRIFMTYAGTASNVSTLAHELGHGYHQHVMDELPELNQNYAMNVAETASTLAELIVSDALVEAAPNEQEKLALLEDKIQRSVAFFMNIHARFLFETRFYEQRKSGIVGAEQLSELMAEAQREAYCDVLAEMHPHFWASKLHFYITDVPFYNYPYTFGYMFSAGIYAHAQKSGGGFAKEYDELLRDTGRMTVEDLASKHLGSDLTKPDFWRGAAELAVKDIELFLSMTE